MLTKLVFTLFGAVIAGLASYEQVFPTWNEGQYDSLNYYVFGLLLLCGILIGLLSGWLVSGLLGSLFPQTSAEEHMEVWDVESGHRHSSSLRTTTGISTQGQVSTIVIPTTETIAVVRYVYEDDSGKKRRTSIDLDEASIIEKDQPNSILVRRSWSFTQPHAKWFATPWPDEYEFHVPNGSWIEDD